MALARLRAEALQLPEAERLALADELFESVELGESWDDTWLAELRRRSAEGHDDAIPWSEAKVSILRRIGRA